MTEMLFEGQRENEVVEVVFRRHWVTMWRGGAFLAVWLGLGIGSLILWPNNGTMLLVLVGCLVVGLLGFFYAYLLWYFSVYIVTNQRIRQLIQKGLFKKSVMDLGWEKIENLSCGVTGVGAGIWGCGTILIRTAVGDLTISMVPKPEAIYNKLQDVAQKAKKG